MTSRLFSRAEDPDIDSTGDGDLFYAIRSSNLYRSGSTKSAGSLVPSPFIMEKNGRLVLATLVAEFNQVQLCRVGCRGSCSLGFILVTVLKVSLVFPKTFPMLNCVRVAKPC